MTPLSSVLAYINPGVGALVIQVVLMGLAGFVTFLKRVGSRIRRPAGPRNPGRLSE